MPKKRACSPNVAVRFKQVKRGAAYVCVPLLFCLIIYLVLYVTVFPMIRPWMDGLRLFMSSAETVSPPSTKTILESIYQPDAPVETGDTVDGKLVEIPIVGTHYADLSLSRIGLQADVYYGDSNEILKKGVGHYIGSMMPGFGQPTLICGHNNREFNLLQFVEIGDVITLRTNYGLYEYEVSEIEIKQSVLFNVDLLAEQEEQLILYTCYPFRSYGINGDRFFVYAKKISGPKIVFH